MKRELRQASGLCLALLALMAQLTLATAVPRASASLAEITRFCRHDAGPPTPSTPLHPPPGCLVCVIWHGAADQPGLLPVAALWLRAPAAQPITAAAATPVPAPPQRIATDARPRGPPILV